MSTPFFSSPASLAALSASAAKWPGTPFCHFGATPGPTGGASCHCLVAAVLTGAGFPLTETMPRVRVNWARHHTGGVMLPWFRARGSLFEEITPATVGAILPGDVLVANLGECCAHHCGIALPDGTFLHTLRSAAGAHTTAIGDPFLTAYLAGIFRPISA